MCTHGQGQQCGGGNWEGAWGGGKGYKEINGDGKNKMQCIKISLDLLFNEIILNTHSSTVSGFKQRLEGMFYNTAVTKTQEHMHREMKTNNKQKRSAC